MDMISVSYYIGQLFMFLALAALLAVPFAIFAGFRYWLKITWLLSVFVFVVLMPFMQPPFQIQEQLAVSREEPKAPVPSWPEWHEQLQRDMDKVVENMEYKQHLRQMLQEIDR